MKTEIKSVAPLIQRAAARYEKEVSKMLTVTDNAKQHLRKLLLARTDDPEFGVRLTVESSGELGLVLGKEAPGDHVVKYQESKVLLVGQEVAERVAGRTLDTEDTPEGPKLVISKE